MKYGMTKERVKIQFTDCLKRIERTAKQKGLRVAMKELSLLKVNLKAWCDDYQVNAECYFDEIENLSAISKNILVKKISFIVNEINTQNSKYMLQ